ncbi:MAG: hypothetical protein WBO47_11860 [Gammaproteobacteria bacterium]
MKPKGIDRQTREEVSGANLIFLSLIQKYAMSHSQGGYFGLQPAAVSIIGSLGETEMARLSRCPFALFSLGFEDEKAWLALLGPRVSESGVAPGVVPGVVQWRATDQLANQFLLVALASVHSIAARNVFMARLLYGIPDSVCDPLARLDLAALPNLAPAVSSRLKARLATCPNFWRDLLTSVYAGGSDSDLSPMRHLGMQLTLQRSLGLRGSRSFDRRLCRGG